VHGEWIIVLRNRLLTLGTAVLAAALVAGCDRSDHAGAASTTVVQPSATPVLESGATAALDEATQKACADLGRDIKDAQQRIAGIARSGGPDEQRAVSAAHSAAARELAVSMKGADGRVSAAARQVAAALQNLAREYSAAPARAPSTAPLTGAIKDLNVACTDH